jgi:valyl-tRNA synthetase
MKRAWILYETDETSMNYAWISYMKLWNFYKFVLDRTLKPRNKTLKPRNKSEQRKISIDKWITDENRIVSNRKSNEKVGGPLQKMMGPKEWGGRCILTNC